MLKKKLWYGLFLIYLVIFCYGFVFLHQYGTGNRIIKEVWDLGHVIGFALLIYFVLKTSKKYAQIQLAYQLLIAVLIAIVLGFSIETIQLYTGRSFSLQDVLLNIVGSVTGVVFFSPNVKASRLMLANILRVLVLASLVLVSKDAIIFTFDAWQAQRQFPVLADFEHPFELTRWRGYRIKYQESDFAQTKALKVEFLPAKYATLVFDHFPRDWSAYKQLTLDIYNPQPDKIKVNIRIHDKHHYTHDSAYTDRYNSQIMLNPGWNTTALSLDKIKHAPRAREMDLKHVHQLMLFFYKLAQKQTLLIRQVRLEK